MSAPSADGPESPPRPRPGPASAVEQHADSAGAQFVNTAGNAIITAARVGRLLGRTGWRIARQLPGMSLVEQVRRAAADELLQLLEMPRQTFGTASPEEQRVMMLVQNADSDPAPLRTAMAELLRRASGSTARSSRDYLFGTIVSQLVPDEARLLAFLADGDRHAVVDVVAKQFGRPPARPVLENASLLAGKAGITPARNAATYLTRLHGLGLVEFGAESGALAADYDKLSVDTAVQEARAQIERKRLGSARLVRKSVTLSALGREFWSACAPDRNSVHRMDG